MRARGGVSTAGIAKHSVMRKSVALTRADGKRGVAMESPDSRLRGNDGVLDCN